MKRKAALLIAMLLTVVGVLAGCSGRVVYDGSAMKEEQQNAQATDGLKMGLALMTKVDSSKDAGAEDGKGQADVSVAAVTVDGEGKVVACTIDAIQVAGNFSKEGKLTTALDAQFQSKNELGEAYGMKGVSTIGKEWNEQAAAFAAYCVGKTSDEIAGITAEDTDLSSGCTMHPGNFQWLVVKAIGNAVPSGAQPTDKIGLGISANIEKSKDAGEEDGLMQAYVTVTGVTTDAEGKVTAAAIDAVQANINFDKTGKITTDLAAEIKTKNELGEEYGMKAVSSIGKEWNEQAAAFATYCVGKTSDEIAGIAAGEDGKAADTDLSSGCTMHPGNFQWLMVKAIGNASGGAQETAELKTGLALMTSVEKSKDAGEEDGNGQADVSIAVVTVDGEGKVVACAIDAIQVAGSFSKEGKLTTALDAQFQSKNELGESYGMKGVSTIGKEWNEQAAAFAAYCVGKTSDEIAGITAEDADLTAGCTMHPGNFQWLVVKAIGNAVPSGAKASDKIGLGISANIEKSKDAGEEDGLMQAYVTVTGLTVDTEGKVTSAAIDAVQANINFDKTGKITTDLTAEIKTKNELGEEYGMKTVSSIGKEWNEQAAAFAAYCLGKTSDEITGIAAGEDGKAADADLAAGCTMHPGNFQWLLAAAIGNAK